MFKAKIGFIGGGNMAKSIISGVISNGYAANLISVVDPNETQLEKLREYGVNATTNVDDIIDKVDILVLAVKPQIMAALAKSIGKKIQLKNVLILSIASGVTIQQLEEWYGSKTAIIRIMPNTPALLKCGASGMYPNGNVAGQQKELAEHLMRSVGVVTWVKDEHLIDVIGAISGSGPAYYFLIMEVIKDVGVRMGLTEKQSKLLTTQTAYGAARMALETSDDLETLRLNVTSKGGITAAAINTFEQLGFRDIVNKALDNNLKRSKELAEMCVTSPKIEHQSEDK